MCDGARPILTYKRSPHNGGELLNIPLLTPRDRRWLIICCPINCELSFSVAELDESSSGQSATVAAVRQREEVGAHLRSGGHRSLSQVSKVVIDSLGETVGHNWCFPQPLIINQPTSFGLVSTIRTIFLHGPPFIL